MKPVEAPAIATPREHFTDAFVQSVTPLPSGAAPESAYVDDVMIARK